MGKKHENELDSAPDSARRPPRIRASSYCRRRRPVNVCAAADKISKLVIEERERQREREREEDKGRKREGERGRVRERESERATERESERERERT